MALSALHLLHGVDPSHLDFFRRQRSHALPTRLRMPPSIGEPAREDWAEVLLLMVETMMRVAWIRARMLRTTRMIDILVVCLEGHPVDGTVFETD